MNSYTSINRKDPKDLILLSCACRNEIITKSLITDWERSGLQKYNQRGF